MQGILFQPNAGPSVSLTAWVWVIWISAGWSWVGCRCSVWDSPILDILIKIKRIRKKLHFIRKTGISFLLLKWTRREQNIVLQVEKLDGICNPPADINQHDSVVFTEVLLIYTNWGAGPWYLCFRFSPPGLLRHKAHRETQKVCISWLRKA